LIDAGAELNRVTSYGESLFSGASRAGNFATVR
jgi:hypothetical protein